MLTCVDLRSVIVAFPGHIQLLSCIINEESFYFLLHRLLKSGQSSVQFMVALIRLRGKKMADNFKNVLNKP